MRAWFTSFIFATLMLVPVASRAEDTVQVVQADFGLANISTSGETSFYPTNTVPYIKGVNYGWVILLKTDKPTVHWKEEFTLPAPAEIWGPPADGTQTIDADRRVSVIEKDASLEGGPAIYNFWAVADGDPKGHYHIRVTIDNQVTQDFDFDVK